MGRLSHEEYFLELAKVVAKRSTCIRRAVGCILVNSDMHIIATGYNGVYAGAVHCISVPCAGANFPSGKGLDICEAIHAEQNALLQCPNTKKIFVAYCTLSPCIHCIKLLLNTSCERIVFEHEYPHDKSKELWVGAGKEWRLKSL